MAKTKEPQPTLNGFNPSGTYEFTPAYTKEQLEETGKKLLSVYKDIIENADMSRQEKIGYLVGQSAHCFVFLSVPVETRLSVFRNLI